MRYRDRDLPAFLSTLHLRLLLLLLVLRAGAAQIAGHACDATAFGATGTGLRYDTQAIQRAIDSCAAQAKDKGGFGTVLFRPPGRFLTGTLFLRSHTVLHILPGATLLASPAQDHYPALRSRWYLLLAENVSDVGVTGGGIIDGQSSKFVQDFNDIKNVMVSWNQTGTCYGDECRPRLIGFLDCQKVRIWNIHLRQPAYWCMHIVRSDDVSIQHVSIRGDFNTPNNDGIDIDSSNNTSIQSCHIDTGDDAICVKTNHGLLHNLTVSRCWIRTKSCAVKLGSQSSFNFHSLRFDDIQIVDSHRGLGLQLRDSGSISDVVFSNFNIHTRYYDLSWWGRAEPIYVTSCPRTPATVVGSITNVSFINISAVSENGIFLSGLDGGLLRNIRLQNVQVQLQRTTNYTGGLLDYRPGCQGLVEHQNSGVFIKKISNLILDNVYLHLAPSIQTSIVPIEFAPATATESIYFVNFSLVLQSSPHDMKLA